MDLTKNIKTSDILDPSWANRIQAGEIAITLLKKHSVLLIKRQSGSITEFEYVEGLTKIVRQARRAEERLNLSRKEKR